MNSIQIALTYFVAGVFTAIINLYNSVATDDPECPKGVCEIITFLIAITVFWPCNVAFNLFLFFRK